jgi:hypothetical protein
MWHLFHPKSDGDRQLSGISALSRDAVIQTPEQFFNPAGAYLGHRNIKRGTALEQRMRRMKK